MKFRVPHFVALITAGSCYLGSSIRVFYFHRPPYIPSHVMSYKGLLQQIFSILCLSLFRVTGVEIPVCSVMFASTTFNLLLPA